MATTRSRKSAARRAPGRCRGGTRNPAGSARGHASTSGIQAVGLQPGGSHPAMAGGPALRRHGPGSRYVPLKNPQGQADRSRTSVSGRILFKLSVRLQGGPKRAAHSVGRGSAPPQRQAQSCGGTLTAPARHSWKAESRVGPAKDGHGGELWCCALPVADRLGPGDASELTRAGAAGAGQGRRAPGLAARSVPGRSSKLKGASRRKRRPFGPPLTSEPLRPSGRSRGQADGLPSKGTRRQPTTDSCPLTVGRQGRLDAVGSHSAEPSANSKRLPVVAPSVRRSKMLGHPHSLAT